MIEIKVENKKSQTKLKPEKGIPVQQEVVQAMTSALMAFRDKMKSLGYSDDVIEKDCRIMINQTRALYLNIVKTQNEPPKNVGPITNETMDDIMKQIDQMINKQ